MANDKNLGWALKNGDLDRVKEIIEGDVSPKFDEFFTPCQFMALLMIVHFGGHLQIYSDSLSYFDRFFKHKYFKNGFYAVSNFKIK